MAAVIALIAGVVILLMFNRSTQKAETGLSACETIGGRCVYVGTCRDEGGTPSSLFTGGCTEDQECCLGIKKALS